MQEAHFRHIIRVSEGYFAIIFTLAAIMGCNGTDTGVTPLGFSVIIITVRAVMWIRML